jgi:hypothetical protein
MRSITDQNGTKWTVSIRGSGFGLWRDVDGVKSELMSVITLSFESDEGEAKYRTAGGSFRDRSLEAISDGELLELLNKPDDDL